MVNKNFLPTINFHEISVFCLDRRGRSIRFTIKFHIQHHRMIKVAVLSLAILASFGEAVYNAQVWQSLSKYTTDFEFPETSLLQSKPNTAIGFTGGGSRAYIAALGYLAGLHELDLLKNIRYIGGISGGAWATTTFSYAQNVASDNILLGPVVPPESITNDNLKKMQSGCARALAAQNLTLIGLNALKNGIVKNVADAWCYGTSKTYLEPVGIKPNYKFSWNADTVKDILKRNPSLSKSDFQVPVLPNRPFPILGSTLVGPAEGAPFKGDTHNFTLLEFTPLYVGQFKTNKVSYKYHLGLTHSIAMGGAVETFAFAKQGGSPKIGMASDHTSATLQVPVPEIGLDLRYAAGASSYAPGTLFESLPKDAIQLALNFSYWSPSDVLPTARDTMFGDGGSYENIPLISFLQRRVAKIVLFLDDSTPLQPTAAWDPYIQPYTGKEVTDCLTAFFGVFTPNQPEQVKAAYDYSRDQVFATEDFAKVITTLQKAQAQGNGIIATFNLTTVSNDWWGIPAGLTSEVTFVYLGRLAGWESKLSSEMSSLLVPPTPEAADLSIDVTDGPYKHFPHYFTMGGNLNAQQSNVLADLTGWTILQNVDLFRSIFS